MFRYSGIYTMQRCIKTEVQKSKNNNNNNN